MNLLKKAVVAGALALTSVVPSAAEENFTYIFANAWSGLNLNPFAPLSQSLTPTNSAYYEQLFFENILTSEVVPVLGTAYEWSDDAKTLTVDVRDGVVWHDGEPFDAADVVFTYQFMREFPELDREGLWRSGLADVSQNDAGQVVFEFEEANTPIFLYLMRISIVPEHIWSEIEDPGSFANENPIGTGPFTMGQFTGSALRSVRFDDYWIEDKPKIEFFDVVTTSGNDPALLMMINNEADAFFGGITDPVGYAERGDNYAYWWPVESYNILYFNTTKAPFDDPAFRRAIAAALDVEDIAFKAYNGALEGASQTAVIPTQIDAWLEPELLEQTVPFDPAMADQMLTDAGYVRGEEDGRRLGLDGQPIPIVRLLTGSGWGDYITMNQLILESLAELGIPAVIDQQVYSAYAAAVQSANYDMAVSWQWGTGSTPYYLFSRSFHPDFSAPVGEVAISNLTRYTHPDVTAAIEAFRSTGDQQTQKAAINTIVSQLLEDMPWIPLTERARFMQYNTLRFENFPNDENPYNSAENGFGSLRMMLLNIEPKE